MIEGWGFGTTRMGTCGKKQTIKKEKRENGWFLTKTVCLAVIGVFIHRTAKEFLPKTVCGQTTI